jgi:Rrf2 family transcriptional regulator, cysteine metabolism repressor
MKLSTKARYALRALAELVGHYGNGTLSLKDIADQQQLSRNYLENLFNAMKVAGLVRSKRGPGGGWELIKAPDQISLTMVLEAVEGELGVVDCVNHPDTCARRDSCPTRDIYVEVSEAIRGVFDRYTIEDLYNRKIDLDKLAPSVEPGEDRCLTPGPNG